VVKVACLRRLVAVIARNDAGVYQMGVGTVLQRGNHEEDI